MTTKTAPTLAECQSQLVAMRQYIEDTLGFDDGIEAEFQVESERYLLRLSGGDKFQRKRDYLERTGRLKVWEPGTDPEDLFAEGWRQLQAHMRRDERELRFSLVQLGDTLEGEQFNTEIGKMIYARMKKVRDDISSSYLPKFEGRGEAGAPVEPGPLSHPPMPDDDIPF